jgi:hypothetical protein
MNSTSSIHSPSDLVRLRRARLERTIGRSLRKPEADDSPLPEAQRRYLLDEARELYWNDLEWENVTGEEELEGGPLTQLTFPGVLAYVRGLLLTEVQSDSLAGAAPRPQVVDDLLEFLAGRVIELENGIATPGTDGDDPERQRTDLDMTSALLDQVLMLYHGVSPEDVGPDDQGSGEGSEG